MTPSNLGNALDGALALSVVDAAHAIGISRATLYVLLAQRKLKSVKIGKRRLVERVEIERFLAAHRVSQ
jgi:excisionase family DNA binding protein